MGECFACMYVCAPHVRPASAHGGQRKVLNPRKQSYVRLVMSYHVVLGTEQRASARADRFLQLLILLVRGQVSSLRQLNFVIPKSITFVNVIIL